jgi:hypothetical protein
MNVQIQRKIIINIRNLLIIANLKAINPCNLKAHVNRAVERSENEYVKGTKVVSVNQLKSGDLSVKTAITKDMETLRQFAGDWAYYVGNRTSVQVPIYGIIAYEIRTNFINTKKFEKIRNKLFMNNKPFIFNAEMWLQLSQNTGITHSRL